MSKFLRGSESTNVPQQTTIWKILPHNIQQDKTNDTSISQDSYQKLDLDYIKKTFARDDVHDDFGKNIQKAMAEAYEKKNYVTFSKSCLEFAEYFYDKKNVAATQEYIDMSSRSNITAQELASNLQKQASKADDKNKKQFAKLLRKEAGDILNSYANILDSHGKHDAAKKIHIRATRPYFRYFGGDNFQSETVSLNIDISARESYKKFVQSLYESGGYKKVIDHCDHALSQLPDDEYFSKYKVSSIIRLEKVVTENQNSSTINPNDRFHSELKSFNHHLLEDYNAGRYKDVVKSSLPIVSDKNFNEDHLVKRTKFILGKAYNRLEEFDKACKVLNEIITEEEFAPSIFFELGKAAIKTNQHNKAYNYYDLFVQNSAELDDEKRGVLINEIAHDVLSNQKLTLTNVNSDLLNHLNQNQDLSDNRLPITLILLKNSKDFAKEDSEKEKILASLNKINPSTIADKAALKEIGLAYFSLNNLEKALQFYNRLEQILPNKENHREIFEQIGDIYIAFCLKDSESLKNPESITTNSFKDPESCKENITQAFQYYAKAYSARGGSDDLELLEKLIKMSDLVDPEISEALGVDKEEYQIHRQHIKLPGSKPYEADYKLFALVSLFVVCMLCDLCKKNPSLTPGGATADNFGNPNTQDHQH